MDFAGMRVGCNYQEEEELQQHRPPQMHNSSMGSVGNGMLSMPSNNSSSSSSPSSASQYHYSRGGPDNPLATTDAGGRWEPRINYHKLQQQQQHLPWAYSRRVDNRVVWEGDEQEEMSTAAAAADARVRSGGGGGESQVTGGTLVMSSSTSSVVVDHSRREHMFDKVVTPSDVGKLNRLVIPKQHAEKYFPLDSSSNDKGLLLNFEDRSGKPWRFRYSYWNSSQSYVMTKGWSRFVKDKRLDAGDIVSFHRGVGDAAKDRLYIDWRRRPDPPPPPAYHHIHAAAAAAAAGSFVSTFSPHHQHLASLRRPSSQLPWTPLLWRPNPTSAPWDHHHGQQQHHHQQPLAGEYDCSSSSSMMVSSSATTGPSGHHEQILFGHQHRNSVYGRSGLYGYENLSISPDLYHQLTSSTTTSAQKQQQQQQQVGQEEEAMVFESVPASAAPRRLRLFGVNMDCPMPSSTASTTIPYHHQYSPHDPTILASQQQQPALCSSTSSSHHLLPLHLSLYHEATPPASSSSSLDFDMLNN